LQDTIRCVLAPADEFRLMAQFGQDRVEHDTTERIVLDAENVQASRVILRAILLT